ncbi:hypothetical protein BA190_20860 [Labrys sp. WJW]|nr:hypothetical protein BA190_20860 [Labrys sp. WJW]
MRYKRCGEYMNVVGHDAPGVETISYPIEMKQSCLHDRAGIGLREQSFPIALVKRFLIAPALLG